MINETALHAALVALAEQQKTQYLAFSAALNELAALRETVRSLDPTFSDVIEQKRKEQEYATSGVVSAQVRLIDVLIRGLRDVVVP